jgi:hypothetical protein
MKIVTRIAAIFALSLGLSAWSAAASAQSSRDRGDMRDKIIAKILLGLGGDAKVETNLINLSGTDDLETSTGLAGHYEHPFNDYFVLGGCLAFQSWTTAGESDSDIDRNTLMDLSVLPKVRYALNDTAELYIAVPIGLTFDSLNDSFYDDADTGAGWNLSFLFGGQLALTDGLGLMGEMGYSTHSFSHTWTLSTPIGNAKSDYDVSLQQFAVTLGMYFAL